MCDASGRTLPTMRSASVGATLLRQLGLDSHRLEYPGRKRLEIDFGEVIREIV